MSHTEVVDFGEDFWKRDRRQSGKDIDVIRGQNIPTNARVIDRTLVPPGVVSHKSTDLRRKSYRRPGSIYRRGMQFVKKLANYTGETRQDHKKGATYYLHWALEGPESKRVLEWFVPLNGVSKDHENALGKVVQDAKEYGVVVRIFRVTGDSNVTGRGDR